MQNQPSLDCKSLSSLLVLPFLSRFLRQSFIGTLLYEMLGPEFPFTRSKKLWTRLLPIFAEFGRCHNRHVTLVADGRPLPYCVMYVSHQLHPCKPFWQWGQSV